MKNKILRISILLAFFIFFINQGISKEIKISEKADQFFSDDVYREIIKKAALDYATSKRLPKSVFERQYPFFESELFEISLPYIEENLKRLESNFSTVPAKGSPAYNNQRNSYVQLINKSVRQAIDKNDAFKFRITAIDENDKIISFNSDIIIESNGKIIVTETIVVYNGEGAENNQIKRGIVRDFPTKYVRKDGLIANVPFNLIDVQRDGEKEPYSTENLDNGIRIYIGSSNYFLERGIFTYKITYETGKQIIFHKDKDEFYWNVTGNGWAFSIGQISCRITFPEKSKIFEYDCYTGFQGSTDKDCNFNLLAYNIILFNSTKAMMSYQGLTVAASIKKGVLQPPSDFENFSSLLIDNLIIPVLIIIFLLYFSINFYAWKKWGKDEVKGTIIPEFEPPAGLSPADTGFLIKQKFTPNLFAASLIDYGVHKLIDIEVKLEGLLIKSPVYYFHKPKNEINENYERKLYELYDYRIENFYGEIAKKNNYNPIIKNAYDSLKAHLLNRLTIRRNKKNIFKGYLNLNNNYTGLGIIFLVLVGIGSAVYLTMNQSFILLIASALIILATLAVQIIFIKIMPSYTPEGRKVVDHILGFKMYLEAAETKIFDTMNPPEKTLELFEKYLPYAIALECENRWAEKFRNIIDKAIQDGYEPSYYRGITAGSFDYSSFSSGISSGLSSTISSASTPPSESSGGSGGGGSSGGGGGGGGGGGW